jgi:hypothetical protein
MQGDAVVARDVIAAWGNKRQAKREGRTHDPNLGIGTSPNELLSKLLWEQQQTNRMLWVMLSDEQREAFRDFPE